MLFDQKTLLGFAMHCVSQMSVNQMNQMTVRQVLSLVYQSANTISLQSISLQCGLNGYFSTKQTNVASKMRHKSASKRTLEVQTKQWQT